MNNTSPVNESLLWEKLCEYAKKAGRLAARPALLLYFVLKSPATPTKDKALIVAALSYLVLPVDLIPARSFPIIGWIDEIVSISFAYKKVCSHITPEIEWKVDSLLMDWFPETDFEVIKD